MLLSDWIIGRTMAGKHLSVRLSQSGQKSSADRLPFSELRSAGGSEIFGRCRSLIERQRHLPHLSSATIKLQTSQIVSRDKVIYVSQAGAPPKSIVTVHQPISFSAFRTSTSSWASHCIVFPIEWRVRTGIA
jgi:hypothetical protein